MNQILKDEDLVHLYLDTQEEDYFEHLYNRYVNKVYRRCLSLTKDSVQAQDFTQDIFVRVLAKLDRFEKRSSFSTWLYSISYNYCMDQLRSGKRLETVKIDQDLMLDVAHEDETESTAHQLQQLSRIMEKLSPKELELLALHYEEGLSIIDIATQLNIKNSAVKMRLKRTRDKLRDIYVHTYGYD